MYWDEVCYFLAVARTGSHNQAALHLKVNHTTVGRRVRTLEQRLGSTLFERTPTGYKLTPAGRLVLPIAERMEEQSHQMERIVAGQKQGLSGIIRFSTLDFMATRITPFLTSFSAQNPNIELQVDVSNHFLSLERRETDVALRFTNDPPPYAFGRKIRTYQYGVFGAPSLIDQYPEDTPLGDYPWVSWPRDNSAVMTHQYMEDIGAHKNCRLRTSNASILQGLVEAGAGIAILGFQQSPKLVALTEALPGFDYHLWLVTHEDVKDSKRIRTFMKELGQHLIQSWPRG